MTDWIEKPLWSLLIRSTERAQPDDQLLSLYRDHGVIRRDSRDDNFNQEADDTSNYLRVSPGDLVVNKMKTWQGSLAISGLAGIVSPAYYVCRVTRDIDGSFLDYALRSQPYIEQYAARSKGIRTNQWDLPFEEFNNVRFLFPDRQVQKGIVRFLDIFTAEVDRKISGLQLQDDLLQQRRARLLDADQTTWKATLKAIGVGASVVPDVSDRQSALSELTSRLREKKALLREYRRARVASVVTGETTLS